MTGHFPKLARNLLFAASAVALCLTPAHAQSQNDRNASSSGQASSSQSGKDNDNFSAGLNLGKNASARDVGLPIYPGARRQQDTDKDSSSLNVGLWGGSSGFKIALLKMETNDSPDKVSAFYRKALAKYGKVLTCGAGDSAPDTSDDRTKSSQDLDCDKDKGDKDGFELKSGTKEKQHIVGISKKDNVTTFQLVYIETRGLDNK
jgi:hypothetical protein